VIELRAVALRSSPRDGGAVEPTRRAPLAEQGRLKQELAAAAQVQALLTWRRRRYLTAVEPAYVSGGERGGWDFFYLRVSRMAVCCGGGRRER
jgi:hypothetical protein